MVVKDNQRLLKKKLVAFFAATSLFEAQVSTATTCQLGHGRLETRQIAVSADVPQGYTGFTGVQQVFRLTRTVVTTRTGVIREESVYGMTSLSAQKASPKRLLALARGHWHIENKSHYVRDVTFDEDRSQVRCGNIPQVMAALRNTVIGLLRVHGQENIASACRWYAARPQAALTLLGI
jgi:predicted transposase YbfD/YdcC